MRMTGKTYISIHELHLKCVFKIFKEISDFIYSRYSTATIFLKKNKHSKHIHVNYSDS